MNKKCVVVSLAMVFCLFFPLSSSGKDKYEKWMKEEVNLIITDAERAVFKKLKSDKEKDLFIQLFWARRDPTPETEENEFREEYYRRLEYA
ncbi:MAG: GWxTD domain-containing protein, partial [Candidatus Aminicenantales bacterium]